MAVEAPVLDGDHRLRNVGAHLVERDGLAAGEAPIGQEFAVEGDDLDVGRAVRDDPALLRQRHGEIADDAGDADRAPEGDDQAEPHDMTEEAAPFAGPAPEEAAAAASPAGAAASAIVRIAAALQEGAALRGGAIGLAALLAGGSGGLFVGGNGAVVRRQPEVVLRPFTVAKGRFDPRLPALKRHRRPPHAACRPARGACGNTRLAALPGRIMPPEAELALNIRSAAPR